MRGNTQPMIENFSFKNKYGVDDLLTIMAILRGEGGCPWDAEQTHESIKKNFIEETYEVIEAINKNDKDLLCEELGDVMLQVVFHAQMEKEIGTFDFSDVADGICKKLIERHPHVFGDVEVDSVGEVLTNWDNIKRKSKGQKDQAQSMLKIPKELPALMRADKIQQKAHKAGFDWDSVDGAIEKLHEETAELETAIRNGDTENIKEELGDLLFSAVNISRFVDVDAEEALTQANDKFINRFVQVQKMANEIGLDMNNASLQELDALWDKAKES